MARAAGIWRNPAPVGGLVEQPDDGVFAAFAFGGGVFFGLVRRVF